MKRVQLILVVITVLLSVSSLGLSAETVTVQTFDDRTFSGTIQAGFPETISIDVQGVAVHVQREKISRIERGGETDIIQTTANETFEGHITTAFPDKLQLMTESGIIEIQYENIRIITFQRSQAPIGRFDLFSRFGAGVSMVSFPLAFIQSELPEGVGGNLSAVVVSGILELPLQGESTLVRLTAGFGSQRIILGFSEISVSLFRASASLMVLFGERAFRPYTIAGMGLAVGGLGAPLGFTFTGLEAHLGGGVTGSLSVLSAFGQAQFMFLPTSLFSGGGLSSGFTLDAGLVLSF